MKNPLTGCDCLGASNLVITMRLIWNQQRSLQLWNCVCVFKKRKDFPSLICSINSSCFENTAGEFKSSFVCCVRCFKSIESPRVNGETITAHLRLQHVFTPWAAPVLQTHTHTHMHTKSPGAKRKAITHRYNKPVRKRKPKNRNSKRQSKHVTQHDACRAKQFLSYFVFLCCSSIWLNKVSYKRAHCALPSHWL